MKQFVIIGTTMFSAELSNMMEGVISFTVNSMYLDKSEFCNLPVYPFENIQDYVDINNTEFVLGVGYSLMNKNRESIYNACKERGFKIHTFVSPYSIVLADNIGEGSIIMPGVYIGPYSNIGIGNIIEANSTLPHHNTIGNFNWIAPGCTFGGGVNMENNCFVGLSSVVRNEIIIRNMTLIGAHSYISKDTQQESVMLGSPAIMKPHLKPMDVIKKV